MPKAAPVVNWLQFAKPALQGSLQETGHRIFELFQLMFR